MNAPAGNKERSIRVFISSTFRDMHQERELLLKEVFPQLSKLCQSRGVTFTSIDLRWGITEEQANRGEVLPICLAEIERCRPYFLGMLGQRYGWVSDSIPEHLLSEQPWLAEHRQQSVTELEILHGVLNNSGMSNRAAFYFRDPSYVQRVPADRRDDFLESSPDARKKLEQLKQTVRDRGLAVRENYADPAALADLVLRDLTTAINQEFPPEDVPDPLDREAAEHAAFAASRTGVYIGRDEYFRALDAHAAETQSGPGVVVLGESGLGKSALLANWTTRYSAAHPDVLVITHYIGATPYGSDLISMLRRVMGELKRHFQLDAEVPDQADGVRDAFANWLHMASERGQVVLVFDALNQLEDRGGALDLHWLPPLIPGNVTLVVSTLPGRSYDVLMERGWPAVNVEPLTPAERTTLITDYLKQFGKLLSQQRAERIIAHDLSANPLFLEALLEELRVAATFDVLDERIDRYLSSETVDDLYERILERYEQDYERDRPHLVRDAMRLLWAARRGLSENELLELLGDGKKPLARAHWSPLYLAIEGSLVSRGGLLGFFHDYLRIAVEDRYLPIAKSRGSAHMRLANYFQRQERDARQIDELPWQICEAGEWEGLYKLLTDGKFFTALSKSDPFQLRTYWSRLEAASDRRIVSGYRKAIEQPEQFQKKFYLWYIASLLADTGHPAEALRLHEHLVEQYRSTGDRSNLQASLSNQAGILQARGDLDGAMTLHKEQERICRELGNKHGLSNSLSNQAGILRARGDLDGAMTLHKQQERIYRELGDKTGLLSSLVGQAAVLYDRGDLDGAMALYKQQERICRELGDLDGLSKSLAGQSLTLKMRGDLDGAMASCKDQERICRELGDKAGLSKSLAGQAGILSAHGDLNGAMALAKDAERICRELGDKAGLARILRARVYLHERLGDRETARSDLEEAMALYSSMSMWGEEGEARAQLARLAAGLSRPAAAAMVVAVLVGLAAFGVAVGIWQPWLWLIGVPMIAVSAWGLTILLLNVLSPNMVVLWARQKHADAARSSSSEGETDQGSPV